MNLIKVQDYFDKSIPVLNFRLAGYPAVSVNVATISNAKRLATSLQDYVHPDVLNFLDLIASKNEEELEERYVAITQSKGYLRFCFYLTVFCGRLELMLKTHAIQYLPMIDIPINTVVDMEYYSQMPDKNIESNPYGVIFGGDIDKLILYCDSMKDNYIRVNLLTDYKDISAIDILGYVENIS